ncbi:MAG: alpha/beta fold hydrolase [Phycisphaerales bacterium]|nr:alpha/beta fold hydrolase [Phycisphaerales bacterium]
MRLAGISLSRWLATGRRFGAILALVCLATVVSAKPVAAKAAGTIAWKHQTLSQWHGFVCHHFVVAGKACWVVEPHHSLPGHPWVWCMKFADAFPHRCSEISLVHRGFCLAVMQFGSMLGSPKSMKLADAFYQTVTRAGLSQKVVLLGISRGGLYAYNWAALHPDRVSVIYGDAPVCDFKSWPGGFGKGRGSPADWRNLLKQYGFKNKAAAMAWKGNPIDELAPIAKANIPLISVVGLADHTVPPAENTFILAERYKKLGGEIVILCKPNMHHHPHGLSHPGVVVDFIVRHALAQSADLCQKIQQPTK